MKHLERALDGQNQVWKYVILLLLAYVGAGIAGAFPMLLVIVYKAIKLGVPLDSINFENMGEYGISLNLSLILTMLPLVLGLFTMIFCLPAFHRRTYKETINGTNHIRWERFFTSAGLWAVILGAYTAFDYYLDPDNFVFQFNLSAFIPLVFISLIIIPLQTTFEELVFRGYLAQGIGAGTGSRWLAWIIPSVVFGLLHSYNPEVTAFGFWTMIPSYIFMGLMFGLVAILDDGIETAMGLHAANNVFLSLFLTNSSSVFQTPAVFRQVSVDPQGGFLGLVIAYGLLILILKKKYHWSFSVLNEPVKKQIEYDFEIEAEEEYPDDNM